MIVVDTCIVTHLFNETSMTLIAQRVLDTNSDWHIPSIWKEEYANVLLKLSKKNKTNPQKVLDLFQYTLNEMQDLEHVVETIEALDCALRYQISAYDAHFVVLAEKLNTHLITEDLEVIKKCPNIALTMLDYLSK